MFGERLTEVADVEKCIGEHRCEGLWCIFCPLSLLEKYTPEKSCCPEYFNHNIQEDQHNIYEALSNLDIDFNIKDEERKRDIISIYLKACEIAHTKRGDVHMTAIDTITDLKEGDK